MFVLPVGTKSSLALKPVVTISIIAACVIIHVLSGLAGRDVHDDLLAVHRDLYADQVKLYLMENDAFYLENGYFDDAPRAALDAIPRSRSYEELESNIYQAMGGSFTCFQELERFGRTLYGRESSFYASSPDAMEIHRRWKQLQAREDEVLGGLVSYSLGLVPRRMGRFWTFLTHIFIHGDIWHLLGNMLFLWVVGCLLEDTWGRWPFLAFYLAGGVFAGWAHCLQDTSSGIPLIGASGAIAAAMGAFTVRHFMTKIKFFYFVIFFFRPIWGTFFLPAFVFLPFWFAQQIALKSLSDMVGGSGVAYMAHIVGYLGGVITALVFKATGFEKRMLDPMVRQRQIKEGVLRDPRFIEALEHLGRGGYERAGMLFSRLMEENPEDRVLQQDIASALRESGRLDESRALEEAALRGLLIDSRHEEACELALRIVREDPDAPADPRLLLKAGRNLASSGRFGEASDIYRWIIHRGASPALSAKAAIALARLIVEKKGDVMGALSALDETRDMDLPDALRTTVEEVRSSISEQAGQFA